VQGWYEGLWPSPQPKAAQATRRITTKAGSKAKSNADYRLITIMGVFWTSQLMKLHILFCKAIGGVSSLRFVYALSTFLFIRNNIIFAFRCLSSNLKKLYVSCATRSQIFMLIHVSSIAERCSCLKSSMAAFTLPWLSRL
jgi:hypothetical protein